MPAQFQVATANHRQTDVLCPRPTDLQNKSHIPLQLKTSDRLTTLEITPPVAAVRKLTSPGSVLVGNRTT